MNLESRKYQLIQELFKIKEESVVAALENILKIDESTIQLSKSNKEELDYRLKDYENNSNNILNWADLKKDW